MVAGLLLFAGAGYSQVLIADYGLRIADYPKLLAVPRVVMLETTTQAKFYAEILACVVVSNMTALGRG